MAVLSGRCIQPPHATSVPCQHHGKQLGFPQCCDTHILHKVLSLARWSLRTQFVTTWWISDNWCQMPPQVSLMDAFCEAGDSSPPQQGQSRPRCAAALQLASWLLRVVKRTRCVCCVVAASGSECVSCTLQPGTLLGHNLRAADALHRSAQRYASISYLAGIFDAHLEATGIGVHAFLCFEQRLGRLSRGSSCQRSTSIPWRACKPHTVYAQVESSAYYREH